MKMYGGVEVYLKEFLSRALEDIFLKMHDIVRLVLQCFFCQIMFNER
jgi:hypothetical protein